jgi:hypothetical protein
VATERVVGGVSKVVVGLDVLLDSLTAAVQSAREFTTGKQSHLRRVLKEIINVPATISLLELWFAKDVLVNGLGQQFIGEV